MSFVLKMLAAVVDLTTWNPADKAADIGLTADNLTASRTANTGANHVNARSVTGRSTGKRYFEITRGVATGSQFNIGLLNASFVLAGANQVPGALGVANSGVGYTSIGSGGSIFVQGAGGLTLAGIGAVGDVATVAVDFGAKLFWARKLGADWNGDPTSNPATGAVGFDISSILPQTLFIDIDIPTSDGTSATLNGGGQPFAGTMPTGFTTWD